MDRLSSVGAQRNHPDVLIFEGNDTEVIDFVRRISPSTTFATCTKTGRIEFVAFFVAAVQRLHIYTHPLLVPLHDVIDAVQIMLRCGNEDTALKEMPFK